MSYLSIIPDVGLAEYMYLPLRQALTLAQPLSPVTPTQSAVIPASGAEALAAVTVTVDHESA
ncbi:hypothetical protein, partial [Streptococcus pneumoniae]|uniref:hypothetical protein n=1 Tax=Streptococcus pneumoniae TaxID=1313 RepID=UPI0012D7B914